MDGTLCQCVQRVGNNCSEAPNSVHIMSVMQPGLGLILGQEGHKDWKSRVKRRSDCATDDVEPTGKPTKNLERSLGDIQRAGRN